MIYWSNFLSGLATTYKQLCIQVGRFLMVGFFFFLVRSALVLLILDMPTDINTHTHTHTEAHTNTGIHTDTHTAKSFSFLFNKFYFTNLPLSFSLVDNLKGHHNESFVKLICVSTVHCGPLC